MTKRIQFFVVLFILMILGSCTGHDQKGKLKDISQSTTDLEADVSIISTYTIIEALNAPNRITRKVRQNGDGNLLMASFEDVILFDGEAFSNFTKETGLDTCDAFDVLEDSKGNIWIASTHFGVFRYDGKTYRNYTKENGLAHNRTMCLLEDSSGNIWIGTQGGASRFDGTSFRNFTTEDGLTHNDINTIMEDASGKIWFGTRGTACIYNPFDSMFMEILNDEGKPFENVWSIIEDRTGNIWLSSAGLWRYDGHTFSRIADEGGICIYEDKKGNIWFNPGHTKLYESGLSRFDAKTLLDEKPMATQVFQTDGTFLGISEDKDGNIWIGGGDGIWKYDGKSVYYYTGKVTDRMN